MSIVDNYKKVKETIPEGVALVLATKYATADDIIELAKHDNIIAGENRAQSLLEKYDIVKSQTDNVKWHFIGHLQTNKVKQIIDKVDLIQSIDSEKLLLEIDKEARAIGKVQKILLEINFFEEKNKTGMSVAELEKTLDIAKNLENITICGIMLMLPMVYDTNLLHKCKIFVVDFCKNKWHNSCIPIISMGMSGDYLDAISIGSNMVRLGSVVFNIK